MRVDAFDYDLPAELIAQTPVERRDASRLLVLDPARDACEHRSFAEFPSLLGERDVLVLNDTRVLAARLIGRKASGGRVELLLLEPDPRAPASGATWTCLLRASRRTDAGAVLHFGDGLRATVVDRDAETWRVRLEALDGDIESTIDRCGVMPLPPYIRREPNERDPERYQTVYASRPGAVAAQTAGLHFTAQRLEAVRARAVEIVYVTLHVGAGTFMPVRAERLADHRMHEERYEIPESTARAVARARDAGGRVVAVGTTVVRTLEHAAREYGAVVAGCGRTDLFIYPGYEIRVADALLTNFHLPRSTLLMLVSAFAGRERILAAYHEAIETGYRFFSYGDAMFVASRPQ